MIIRIMFCVLSAVGFFTAEAHAQLFLENGKETLSVSGGDRPNGSLTIQNTSAQSADIKVYWEDFEYKAPYDGGKNFLPAGTSATSASQWITFSPQQFTLPAYGKQRIDFTVTVPNEIKEGHYGVLFFEKSGTMSSGGSDEVNIVTRVGCLFFIEPKEKNKKAVLQNIVLKTKSVTADFVNQGNVVLIPRTTYYIMNTDGLVLLRGEVNKVYVPAGATATLEVPLKKQLAQGQYTLVVNSDLDEGDAVVKEIGLAVDASGQITIESSQD